MATDESSASDGVGLNPLGSSGGALVATDLVSINGNQVSHVQYMKMGWGSTGDEYFEVGHEGTAKPLPVMLRDTDGDALSATDNVLDVRIASQGSLAISADILHTLGAIRIEGTAGAMPIHVMGSSASEAVLIQATGGTFSATNPQYTLPTMLFGLSGGNSAAPVGVTGTRLLVNHPENVTIISDGSGTYVQATGGATATTLGEFDKLMPTLLYGVCGGTAATVGVTNGKLDVHIVDTVAISQTLTGSAGLGGTKTMPSLMYGLLGASAQAIQSTGGRLVVDWLGQGISVGNGHESGLYIRATAGVSGDQTSPVGMLPTILYGHTAGGGFESVAVSGGLLAVDVRAACITLDVTLATTQKVLNATADAGNIHHRYLMVSGVTNNGNKPEEQVPIFVTGKADGTTASYPMGITTCTSTVGSTPWSLMVTGETEVKTWSAGTLTVDATALDVRGLTAIGGKDIIGVVGVSNSGEPVWVTATGGTGGNANGNLAVHSTVPSLIFGVCGAGGAGGASAAAVGITGINMLHVGIGHPVAIDASATNPLRIQATGGLSASSGNNARLPLDVTLPSLIMGLSAGADTRGAPIGMSADALKVYDLHGRSAGRDTISVFGGVDAGIGAGDAGGTYNIPWIPSLMMGCSGASAAGIGMSGDALNVNMTNAGITVEVTVGTHIEVSNDYGAPLYVAGSSSGGACGGENPYPISVASNYLGESVFVQGTAGMQSILVHGFSSSNDCGKFAVGVTSGHNWNMASDDALLGPNGIPSGTGIGGTLDFIYNIIANGLAGDDPVGTPVQKFATQQTLSAMAPDGTNSSTKIANADNQNEHNIHLANISSAFGPTADATQSLNVNIVAFQQPDSFAHGQIQIVGGAGAGFLQDDAKGLCSGVKIKGHQNNQDYLYVGGAASVDQGDGYPLGPSEEIFLEIDQLKAVYVFATTSGTACYIAS